MAIFFIGGEAFDKQYTGAIARMRYNAHIWHFANNYYLRALLPRKGKAFLFIPAARHKGKSTSDNFICKVSLMVAPLKRVTNI
jgi:hypothetical protein